MKPMIFLAEGFEESEALLPLDILRRGGVDAIILRRGGVDAITVSVSSDKVVKSSHGVQIVADAVINEISAADVQMIILPGGLPGATNLDASEQLDRLIMDFASAGKPLAAICAAPMVYGKRGLLRGKKATCYPGFDKYLDGAEYTGALVECVDNFILGKGPAAAAEFGFAILEKLSPLPVSLC